MPPLADILHRTLVVGLLGMTVAGVGVGGSIRIHSGGGKVRQPSSSCNIRYAFSVLRFGLVATRLFEFFIPPCTPLVSRRDHGLIRILCFVL